MHEGGRAGTIAPWGLILVATDGYARAVGARADRRCAHAGTAPWPRSSSGASRRDHRAGRVPCPRRPRARAGARAVTARPRRHRALTARAEARAAPHRSWVTSRARACRARSEPRLLEGAVDEAGVKGADDAGVALGQLPKGAAAHNQPDPRFVRARTPAAGQRRHTLEADGLLGRPARLESLDEDPAPALPGGHRDSRRPEGARGTTRERQRAECLPPPLRARPRTAAAGAQASLCLGRGDDESASSSNGQVCSHGVVHGGRGSRTSVVTDLGDVHRCSEALEQARAGRVGERSMASFSRSPCPEYRRLAAPDGIGEFPYGGSGPATMRPEQISPMIDV